jgi:hypothetical protein
LIFPMLLKKLAGIARPLVHKVRYLKNHVIMQFTILLQKIKRRALSISFESFRSAICTVMLGWYRFVHFFRRHDEVKSVLHISLLSSKQYMLSRLLRDHGKKAHFLALNTGIENRLLIGYDYDIPYGVSPLKRKLLEIRYLWTVLARHDVIHFHFNALLSLDDGWELEYLKKMKKVIVFHFRGCDLRQKSINMSKNPEVNCCMDCDYPEGSCDNDYQRMRISKAVNNGDLFFVTTPDLRDFFSEAEHVPFISPYGIDFDGVIPAPKEKGIFRIVTSSNHPAVDGLQYLRQAVSRLQGEGFKIEYVEVVKKPLAEALSLYKSADLYAGKLLMGYYNNANIETMLMGVPNMSYIREEYLSAIPDCPIIIAGPDNIYEKLKEWVQKPEELKKIGEKCPSFIRKYHNSDKIIEHMIDRYNEVFREKNTKRKVV